MTHDLYILGMPAVPYPPLSTRDYDPPHRRLRRWVLCAHVLRFEDILRGSGSLEAVRVSGSGLFLRSWSI